MEYKNNKKLVLYARNLRKEMTKEERHLWYDFLKPSPMRFQRQKVLGKYIADFYCAKAKMVVELDGSQHYEEAELEKDRIRTAYLEQYDLLVVRIPNNEIFTNFPGVCQYIMLMYYQRISELGVQ